MLPNSLLSWNQRGDAFAVAAIGSEHLVRRGI